MKVSSYTLFLNHSILTMGILHVTFDLDTNSVEYTGSPLHSSPVVVSLRDKVALLPSHMQDIWSAWSVAKGLLLFTGHG